MPCKYPRLPTGPSPVGSAGVRALESTGGEYQRKRPDVDTVSMLEGEFKRVLTDGFPQYVTRGTDAADVEKVRDTKEFRLKFSKSAAKDTGVSLGRGRYLEHTGQQLVTSPVEYTYEIYPGTTRDITVTSSVYLWTYDMASYYSRGFTLGGLLHYETYFNYVGSFYRPLLSRPSALGKYENAGVTAIVVNQIPGNNRFDPAGRDLYCPAITVWRQKGSNFSVYLHPDTWTREDAEFCPLPAAVVVTESAVMFVLAEMFFRPGPTVSGEDYHPKFWLMHGSVDSPYIMQALDVTDIAFDAAEIPSPSTSPVSHYTPSAGNEYNRKLTQTMGFVRTVALPGDVGLWFYAQSVTGGWVSRIMRVSRASGTAAAAKMYESPVAPLSSLQFVQHAEHLGSGVVLAKRIGKFGGIDASVVFMRSVDGGLSWSDFTPVGFDCPLLNQYLGNFKAHRAKDEDSDGIVLIPAWSVEKQAYCVYSSEDLGTTWERKSVIYKPVEFRRIDTILADDGGANFMVLRPGPDPKTPVDVTIPDRYKRDGNV